MTMHPCPLGRRELETVRWLSLGKTAKETAALLCISTNTVNNHITRSMDRTGTQKATGLVGKALREGWIE
jgi:DNA-binding CsgD family transcriptional regulator